MSYGIVFNIQKCSIHDGPGIRTLVFLKGCPLRCLWCANPESQNPYPEIASLYKRCIGCGDCEKICPRNAVYYEGGVYRINNELCDSCQQCVNACYANSKQYIGKKMSVDEALTEILKDSAFYRKSGGGVTFSGGEPLMQPDFLTELLHECKRFNVNTAIETSGYCNYADLNEAAKYLDTIYFDIKHVDPDKHKKLTGVSNGIIIENLSRLAKQCHELIIRIPIIPGYNDTKENLTGTAQLCTRLESVKRIELLPYHNLGEYKYHSLGRKYELADINTPGNDAMDKYLDIVKSVAAAEGIECNTVHF